MQDRVHGTLYTDNFRSAKVTDRYTFAESGTVTYEPTFTQHGFRYIEITGLDAPPALDAVKGVVWGSDLPRIGRPRTPCSTNWSATSPGAGLGLPRGPATSSAVGVSFCRMAR
jgi:hypothetical protein